MCDSFVFHVDTIVWGRVDGEIQIQIVPITPEPTRILGDKVLKPKDSGLDSLVSVLSIVLNLMEELPSSL